MNRREMLKRCAVAVGSACLPLAGASSATLSAALPGEGAAAAKPAGLQFATNLYPWGTFYKRAGKPYDAAGKDIWQEVAGCGFDGIESSGAPANLADLLTASKLSLRSLYVNSTLHDPARSGASIDAVLATAAAAKPHGCTIIVTNPEPIRWGGPENKTDAQLLHQAESLNRLGAELRKQGQVLAYHNHDIELRNAARELHHMLAGTDPESVRFCLDAHWVYRGSGDSQVALFDVVKLYGKRVVELHIRQSQGGVWTEAFGPGDIDYKRLAEELAAMGVRPHLVLEQAVEKQSPVTLDVVEAHKRGLAHARNVFTAFAD